MEGKQEEWVGVRGKRKGGMGKRINEKSEDNPAQKKKNLIILDTISKKKKN